MGTDRRSREQSAYVTKDLTTGSIPRNLWFLAWPQMVEGAMRVVDWMADLVWAGHIGYQTLAGLGVAQQYVQMTFTARLGLDTGMRAMVARAMGMRNIPLANLIVFQAAILTFLVALLFAFIGVFFTEPLLRILNVSDAVIAQGALYMRIQFVGQLAVGLQNLSGNALAASGDSLTPMKSTILARIVHITLSPILVFGWLGFPALGLAGAAVANIVAHSLALAMLLVILFRGTSRIHLKLQDFRVDWGIMVRLLKLGGPAAVNQTERALSQLILVGLVAPFGDYTLAAYTLTRRVEMFSNMGSQGFGQASGIIAGQNLGARKPERSRQTVLWAVGYVLFIQSILGALLLTFPGNFLSIFNEDPQWLSLAQSWLRILVFGFLTMGVTQVFMQSFQTAGDTIMPMVVSLATMWLVQQPLALLLSRSTPLEEFGVAWAVVISMAARVVIYIPYFFWGRWLHIRIFSQEQVH
ncbi:MAG: MATE family efflux transporter [Chloroflexi bacterium]|nr:MATE family efflux transporter [Chloroflexota bacterium]